MVHIPLSQLRQLPGARELDDAWIGARLGEDGYLSGTDAETAACDAQVVPVVTGTMDPSVIDQMINLARTAAEAQDDGPGGTTGAGTAASACPAAASSGTADGGATAGEWVTCPRLCPRPRPPP